jgi:chorismate dehydratase
MIRIATVSYLNALPLIAGLEGERGIALTRLVPSRLLATIEAGEADLALCPVIDFQTSGADLEIVPSGAIGCDGAALTVKLFSRLPFADLKSVVIDGDSHTSVALLRIVLHELHDCHPVFIPSSRAARQTDAEAILLIGDKVVTSTPDPSIHRHRLDLGAAWKTITGMPFVFATWMARSGRDLGEGPNRLAELRRVNRNRLAELVAKHAAACGWPDDLALDYLSRNLRYGLGDRELAGIEEFWRRCRDLGIIDELRPLKLYGRAREGERVRKSED